MMVVRWGQQMAACCLTGTQSRSREAEAVSDVPQPVAHRPPPIPPTLPHTPLLSFPLPQQPQKQRLRIEEVLSHCMQKHPVFWGVIHAENKQLAAQQPRCLLLSPTYQSLLVTFCHRSAPPLAQFWPQADINQCRAYYLVPLTDGEYGQPSDDSTISIIKESLQYIRVGRIKML